MSRLHRFGLRQALGGLLAFATLGLAQAARPSRPSPLPNLIIVVADDLGYGDLGAYGQSRIRTPHLDRMADEGMRFTQAYAGNAVSAPSRCALMTGLHSGRGRVRSNTQVPLEPGDITIAEVLRNAGYRNAFVGKWGLGWEGTTGHPNAQGFDEFLGYLDQTHSHDHYPVFLWRNSVPFFLPGNQEGRRTEYSPDWLLRAATNVIRIYEDRPFFLCLAPTLPQANPALGTNGMEVPNLGDYAGKDWPLPEKRKAAMITRLDAMVGHVLEDLRRRRLDDTTLVVFTSGNGPHNQAGVDPAFFQSAGTFRGIKGDLYEGGLRVPLIAWWPGTIAPGTTNELPVAAWDLLPTLAEIAGTQAPKDLDGVSIAPALFGRPQRRRPGPFYWELHDRGEQRAGRLDDWKAVLPGTDRPLELYNLRMDPGETSDVAAAHPEVVGELETLLRKASRPWQPTPDRSTNAAGAPGRRLPPNPADRIEELRRQATNAPGTSGTGQPPASAIPGAR